ncbi:beta-glucosidase H [Kluyveromyces lactis]|uniref:beta-glucosidase n=1 Tax=Kluyveromyces lactis (strain ATCC 8585 / CBS 2359 / DSM 70799 / NBRC 1267 / NRRL Y-1140 / WM37) TaxID=284590 RepID=Q6CN80_KLULA|nr:uncharacterized protein KLLA0_E14631g [Kluyveromyces lactis]CAG99696.1 KLLA0E14631p [Kluyveromyces lactis]|eukprot:XP_454609.1 uncharacterized protein KLLA0_E14631g [Kluyveromyces lactis]
MSNFDIEQTLSELTRDEKISLLSAVDFWHTKEIERLGIPSVRVSDGPNGIRGTRFFDSVPSGCFPNGTGLASTFDDELLKEAGKLMAKEAVAKNAAVILGPTTNMQRGPLGGRGFESFSEDPYLAGVATSSVVQGMQSEGIAATVKHFVCNDLEDQRFASNSILSERALREIYLEPFRLAIKNADPVCLMTAYNKVNGEHCSQNKKLLLDILRKEWNWDGMIMSDWYGTYTTAASIKNGLDIEFPGPTRWRTNELVSHSLNSKEQISIYDVDDRVRQVLKMIKFVVDNQEKTGIVQNGPETTSNNTKETSELLRKIAADSIVLLKNENSILPLKKEESIVVIGPNAKAKASSGGGSASVNSYYVISPYEGIVKKVGKEVPYTIGAESHKTLSNLIEQLVVDPSKPAEGDNAGATGSFYSEPVEKRAKDESPFHVATFKHSFNLLFDFKHEKIDTTNPIFYITLEGYFTPEEDADYIFGLQVFGTGVLYLDDELLIDQRKGQVSGDFCFGAGTIEKTKTVTLQKGKAYKVRIEYGSGPTSELVSEFGSGALQVGVTKAIDADEEIKKAAKLAAAHDKAILCIGLNAEWESEGHDREDMTLPARTNDLVRAVLEANPNTVIVNQSGTPVEFPWLQKANALVQAWYGGNELGNAIADVLYGDVVPNGKLSLSWPLKLEDNPAYLNFKTEFGRVVYGEDIFIGYRFYEKLQKRVAFPFGYGLSYTEFALSNLQVQINDEVISVSVDVKNTGEKYAGSEVVQVYIAATESSVSRAVKELKGFKKVLLQPGQTETAKIDLVLKDSVSFFDEEVGKWCSEAGQYKVLVGTSSDDIVLSESFDVEKTSYWSGL